MHLKLHNVKNEKQEQEKEKGKEKEKEKEKDKKTEDFIIEKEKHDGLYFGSYICRTTPKKNQKEILSNEDFNFEEGKEKGKGECRLDSVEEIQLSSLSLTDWGFSILVFCILRTPNLRVLNLSNNNLTNDCATTLANCMEHLSFLRSINLANNKIKSEGAIKVMEMFFENVTLKPKDELYNKKKKINKIKKTEKRNSLNEYSSSINEISQRIETETEAETDTETVYEIDLSDNYLNTEFILNFCVLLENEQKKKLFLRNIGISDIGISNIFKRCKYIETLDLSQNIINADLFPQYCMSLFNAQTNLKELYLTNICCNYKDTIKTKMGNEILIELLKHLHKAKHLCIFSFANNGIDDIGFQQFCSFLKHNTHNKITEVDFSDNIITRIDYLNESQQINGILKVINLSNNKITDSSIKLFCEETLSKNLNISELNLSNNNLFNNTCKYISDALIAQSKKVQKLTTVTKKEENKSYSSIDTCISKNWHDMEEEENEVMKCIEDGKKEEKKVKCNKKCYDKDNDKYNDKDNDKDNDTDNDKYNDKYNDKGNDLENSICYQQNHCNISKVSHSMSILRKNSNVYPEDRKSDLTKSCPDIKNCKYTNNEEQKTKERKHVKRIKKLKRVIINRHCEESDFFTCINKIEFNRATDISKKLHLQYMRRKYIYNINDHFHNVFKDFSVNCFKGLKILNLSGTCLNNEGVNLLLNALKTRFVPLEFLDLSSCTYLNDSVYHTLSTIGLKKKMKFLKNKTVVFKYLPLTIRGTPPPEIHLDDSEDELEKRNTCK